MLLGNLTGPFEDRPVKRLRRVEVERPRFDARSQAPDPLVAEGVDPGVELPPADGDRLLFRLGTTQQRIELVIAHLGEVGKRIHCVGHLSSGGHRLKQPKGRGSTSA